jgi:hypothetical protein
MKDLILSAYFQAVILILILILLGTLFRRRKP